jgi:5'-nucleotidase
VGSARKEFEISTEPSASNECVPARNRFAFPARRPSVDRRGTELSVPADLSKSLVIGISSRALFDLEEADAVYRTEGSKAFARYQLEREHVILKPGAGFPIVQSILDLNAKVQGHRRAEVVVMSRNSPATSLRMFHSIDYYGLDIQRAALAGGASLAPYLKAFSVDLYLSADEGDVKKALSDGIAAAAIYPTATEINPYEEIRIAFDGDAVLFSEQADLIFTEQGPEAFVEYERNHALDPLPEGPFGRLLRTLSILQKDPHFEKPPIRIALVTSRSMPAHLRVLYTLRAWNVDIDEAFFMGGVAKTEILRAFRPHIFFDDQESHCRAAADVVSTARVLRGLTQTVSVTIGEKVDDPSTVQHEITEVIDPAASPQNWVSHNVAIGTEDQESKRAQV